MAIAGRIDPNPAPETAPGERAQRRNLRLEVTGELNGSQANVTVHNISESGLLMETAQPLAVGEWFNLTLPEAGTVEAEVIWVSGQLHGCRFSAPVNRATLSASQLRGVVAPAAPEPERPVAPAPAGPTLGRRLAAARHARGMTLGQVASTLGVSRPTVWAWEQDRARPAPHRLGLLAACLGVEETALTGTEPNNQVTQLVEEARVKIAAAAGTLPTRVRILIEL
ncbi:helix-turn-helix domain-containing protein [Novosphingobium ginsenosidimutans]|uniref:Helix-turn-helix domain-containing protein n=1 Tax=Novosphingobium ginsenosidimutans TaxID=1176536 RepID=A0A5B8S982_9SPHN|nr:helix-turn-helix domain-containing protein [Novosphingobium ginsenosidimutans]QEA14636.1 helix-turn-helix domain-containing protein [Novosphingobium ginsenosidimutans]QEA17390.1 helix-turn-helix domain-containing protein [Novosphingobium ginsenosidimutans]